MVVAGVVLSKPPFRLRCCGHSWPWPSARVSCRILPPSYASLIAASTSWRSRRKISARDVGKIPLPTQGSQQGTYETPIYYMGIESFPFPLSLYNRNLTPICYLVVSCESGSFHFLFHYSYKALYSLPHEQSFTVLALLCSTKLRSFTVVAHLLIAPRGQPRIRSNLQ